MKRLWLLFSQVATVLLAAYFVVATLKPDWLGKNARVGTVSVIEAPVPTGYGAAPGSAAGAAP
jgi:serine protease DegQ